jgi:hypothetical protein
MRQLEHGHHVRRDHEKEPVMHPSQRPVAAAAYEDPDALAKRFFAFVIAGALVFIGVIVTLVSSAP